MLKLSNDFLFSLDFHAYKSSMLDFEMVKIKPSTTAKIYFLAFPLHKGITIMRNKMSYFLEKLQSLCNLNLRAKNFMVAKMRCNLHFVSHPLFL